MDFLPVCLSAQGYNPSPELAWTSLHTRVNSVKGHHVITEAAFLFNTAWFTLILVRNVTTTIHYDCVR